MRFLLIGDFQGVFSEKLFNRLKKENFDFVVSVGDYGGLRDWKPYHYRCFRNIKAGIEPPSPEEFFGKKRLKLLEQKEERMTKEVYKKLNALGKKVIFVFGNNDYGWHKDPFDDFPSFSKRKRNFVSKLKNMQNIDYKIKKIAETYFLGFGGHMDTGEDTGEAGKKFMSLVKEIRNRKNRIFVFHYPPKGAFDAIKDRKNPFNGKKVGVKIFSDAIKRYGPSLVLCGHMEEYQGMKKLHRTLVINAGGAETGKYAIIDFDEYLGKLRDVRFIK